MSGKIPVRTRLLQAAAELFYKDGVSATGIDTITARAGVAKMSLYNNFSSKADLVNGYLRNRVLEWQGFLAERLEVASSPMDQVLAVFDSYLDHAGLAYEWGFRGCGLLNAAAELPMGDPGRATVAFQKEEAERLFKQFLSEINGLSAAEIAESAQHLSFLLEGAMARAGLDGNDAALKAARTIAISVVEGLGRNATQAEESVR